MVSKVATWMIVHGKIEVFFVLKRVQHINDKWVLQLRQYFPLVDNRMYTPFCQHSRLIHFLHSKFFSIFFSQNFPDLAKSTFPDRLFKNEITSLHFVFYCHNKYLYQNSQSTYQNSILFPSTHSVQCRCSFPSFIILIFI